MIDIDTLAKFNPWWTGAAVPPVFLGSQTRPLFKQLHNYLDKRQIILLYGLRRVGKTTLFYQLIQYFLDHKVNPLHIFYFSFDEKVTDIDELLKIYAEKVLKKSLTEVDRLYIFFDEIQKKLDWQSKIKLLYDLYPQIKFFLSGSASVSLQKKSKESLAGRIFDFFLEPLSFSEFLVWQNITIDPGRVELYASKLRPLFLDFLRKGGFPEITKETDDKIIKHYLKNTVLDRIIYKDLPLEFGLKDIELLNILIEMIVTEPGMIINFDKLSRDLGRTKVTIINYFEYLKYALVICEIKNLRGGLLVSSRKAKKVYPTNTALCFALRDDFYQESVLQKIAETAVVATIHAKHYFRNSFEIDVVVKKERQVLPIEVKYGQVDTKSMYKFLEKFKAEKGIIITKDISKREDKLSLIPLWQFLLFPEVASV